MKIGLGLSTVCAVIAVLCNTAILAQQHYAAAAVKPALTIRMTESKFKPDSAHAHVGDTVLFANDDEVSHNVVGGTTAVALDSKAIAPGRSWTFTFSKPGTYTYVCTYHPWMKGTITVLDKE